MYAFVCFQWVMTYEFTNRYKEMVYGNDWLIDPRSRFSTNWDIFVAILLVTVIFTMPLSMAFTEAQDNLYALDLTADVVFILDIVKVSFLCVYVLDYPVYI